MFNLYTLSKNQLKWFNHYTRLIDRARNRLLEGYKERHHIVPRCMGGTDEKTNLVDLTPEEHYVAHQLLVKIFPNHNGLISAAFLMSCSSDTTLPRSKNKQYSWLKKRLSNNRKGKTKDNDASIKAMADKLRGRTKEEYGYLQEVSMKMTGRTKEEYEYLQERSKNRKGKNKTNCEYMKNMADKLTGRTKEEYEYLQSVSKKTSLRKKGKNKTNCQFVKNMAETKNKLPTEIREQVIEKRNQGQTFPMIHKWLLSLDYNITCSAIGIIYRRETKSGIYATQ